METFFYFSYIGNFELWFRCYIYFHLSVSAFHAARFNFNLPAKIISSLWIYPDFDTDAHNNKETTLTLYWIYRVLLGKFR